MERTKDKSVHLQAPQSWGLTLDGLGMLLDLTLSNACCYIPHYDLAVDIGRSQAQAIR